MAIVWLELSVQILVQVNLVREGVDAVAVIPIVVYQLHSDLIQSNLKHITVQNNLAVPEKVANGQWWHCLPVYYQVGNIRTKEIKENWILLRTWHFCQVERNSCFSEILCSLG